MAAARYARGRLLDAFSYHGGFALALAPLCAQVLAVDISDDAVARITANAARNGLTNVEARAMNVFDELRELERRGEQLRHHRARPAGLRQEQGGGARRRCPATRRSTCARSSCSRRAGSWSRAAARTTSAKADFADVLAAAAVDAHADVVVVEKRMQGRDHPMLMTVPETYYLKCFILRKL